MNPIRSEEKPGRPGGGFLPVYLHLAGVFVVYLAARWFVFGGELVRDAASVSVLDNPLAGEPLNVRLLGGFGLLWRACRTLVFPFPLSTDYSLSAIPVPRSPFDPGVLLGAGCLLALLIVAWRAFRRGGPSWVGVVILLASWFISSNVIIPIGTIFGLRLLYLPSVGFAVILAASMSAVGERFGVARARLVSGMICLLYGCLAVSQVGMWRSEEDLVLRSLRAEPESARLNYLAGGILAREGRDREAGAVLEKSLEIFPENASARAIHGMVLVRTKRVREGVREVELANRENPDVVLPMFPHLAKELLRQGERVEALRILTVYLEARPGDPEARRLLETARTMN